METSPLQEIVVRQQTNSQIDLPLATDGVLRYVWEGRFGAMLIEVKQGRAFVNGEAIEPAVDAENAFEQP